MKLPGLDSSEVHSGRPIAGSQPQCAATAGRRRLGDSDAAHLVVSAGPGSLRSRSKTWTVIRAGAPQSRRTAVAPGP